MVRFHPQWLRVREIIRRVNSARSAPFRGLFSYFNVDPAKRRNQPISAGAASWISAATDSLSRAHVDASRSASSPSSTVTPHSRPTARPASSSTMATAGRPPSCARPARRPPDRRGHRHQRPRRDQDPFNARPTPRPSSRSMPLQRSAAPSPAAKSFARWSNIPKSRAFALAVLGEQPMPYGVEEPSRTCAFLMPCLRARNQAAGSTSVTPAQTNGDCR